MALGVLLAALSLSAPSAESAKDKLENSRIESGIASIRSALREGVLE